MGKSGKRNERKNVLRAAERASACGDHATAARLFHSVGISYVPAYSAQEYLTTVSALTETEGN